MSPKTFINQLIDCFECVYFTPAYDKLSHGAFPLRQTKEQIVGKTVVHVVTVSAINLIQKWKKGGEM
jgi:hypothetical protein